MKRQSHAWRPESIYLSIIVVPVASRIIRLFSEFSVLLKESVSAEAEEEVSPNSSLIPYRRSGEIGQPRNTWQMFIDPRSIDGMTRGVTSVISFPRVLAIWERGVKKATSVKKKTFFFPLASSCTGPCASS